MDAAKLKSLVELSPFELKDLLQQAAAKRGNAMMLNAGRGNPNFLATIPRHGFFQLGLFAMSEADRSYIYMPEGVGGFPARYDIEARLDSFVAARENVPGIKFLSAAVSYVRDQLGLPAGDFIYEMCEAILGCNYPVPGRMLRRSERIVGEYIRREMIGRYPFSGHFDMYAVEGGTAAMTYIFNSLKENHLIKQGDTIALGMPIFTPYIEIPELNDYQLNVVHIESTGESGWQFPRAELDKLLDPKVKAFFLVNPSNPPSVTMDDITMQYIAQIVKRRPDLIILTDDVYGTFADNFVSLFAVCPHNTILVYSFSKYFGATGWRMGVVVTHENNVLDKRIAALPEQQLKELDARYQSITVTPRTLKFIDRLVADSRTVALNHTAGLATPVQVQMVLFSLFSLMDEAQAYKAAMKRIVHRRKAALYREMGVAAPHNPHAIDYYHLIDALKITTDLYGADFSQWLLKTLAPNEALFQLAESSGVVLLPGRGFGTSDPSGRVSLANLDEPDYIKIGVALRKLVDTYYARYLKEGGKAKA